MTSSPPQYLSSGPVEADPVPLLESVGNLAIWAQHQNHLQRRKGGVAG